jgi:copper chaperone CopZ
VVKKTLLKHEGILDVRANVAADLLLVDYEADKVSLEDILAVIRKTGYKALPIR